MLDPDEVLANLPEGLRDELVTCYRQIARNYTEQRWEPAELNGGKLCEVIHSISHGALAGSMPASATKPSNMVDACKALEPMRQPGLVGERSFRILIPRLLPFLYEIRNNRGVGHVGGEVDPNREDAEAVMASAKWLMAELVRIYHELPLVDAQAAVDALVERVHPLVWEAAGTKRVLNPSLTAKEQVLVLLYATPGWVAVEVLNEWVEYAPVRKFRTRVLTPLHDMRAVEYANSAGRVMITPLGVAKVEAESLLDKT